MLYPKSRSAELRSALFANPSAEYRGTPFWSWNNRLDGAQLLRQIGYLKEMGFGGFHMHPRTGMATPYLGKEFMDLVRLCTVEAKRREMLAWLYDEDRWPSGFAGGLVTCDPRFRMKHLLWTRVPYGADVVGATNLSNALGNRTENGALLTRHEVVLKKGRLVSYRRLRDDEQPSGGGVVWHAYVETAAPVPWYNHQTYVDVMNPRATERFIEVTHERYKQVVGEFFGETVPAIFTDEPQVVSKEAFKRADESRDICIPWTGDLSETFEEAFGGKIEERLPELFWELPGGKASPARYRYHDHVTERFAAAYAEVVGKWCEANGIALTGHMMEEATLFQQTKSVGEAMRSLAHFQLPGIDMLCDFREFTTAKQAQSVARQFGREGVMSELYGVTNWDFDFVGHKAQGDWQAALGVTVRVPHLCWVSMAGEAKRDYPASIFYQSPWYREYPLIEDHFARLGTVLTRGKPLARIAVIHPIESYWLAFGPVDQTGPERLELEENFTHITEWMIFAQLDFDYLSEGLLPGLCKPEALPTLNAGAMRYDAVIVPALRTIRATTLDRLEAFADAGGTVIFAGEIPHLVDAAGSDRAEKLAARCVRVPFRQARIVEALEAFREIEIRVKDGSLGDSFVHQIRCDGAGRHVFICNTDRVLPRPGASIRFAGAWKAKALDTIGGREEPVEFEQRDGMTIVHHDFTAHGHLLLTLEPGVGGARPEPKEDRGIIGRLADPVPITLSEPNVLLLDQAEWRIDGGQWQPADETLRIENHARAHFGLPQKSGDIAQPWAETDPAPVLGTVQLRFAIASAIAVKGALLAIEDPGVEIHWNGESVAGEVSGWWVDEAIKTVALPAFGPGVQELTLSIPFTRKADLEWCYLLGDFGVEVRGRHARLTAPVRDLAFGDWTRQGLPFYAGNVTYHCELECGGEELTLQTPQFKAPLLSVALDGKRLGPIAFAPFEIGLGCPSKGRHTVDITAYGNRVNAFGQLHNVKRRVTWWGPNSWRTEGGDYSYEYQLRGMGVLTAPLILKEG